MAIVVDRQYQPVTAFNDPDDYRPNSEIALVIDPATPAGDFVQGLTVLFENCAPGDCLPLHTHPHDEILIIDEGTAEATLDGDRRTIGPGSVVFIPAGKPHGTRNIGDQMLRLHAVFPSSVIAVQYLERNPAPGTEHDPPQPPVSFNVREVGST